MTKSKSTKCQSNDNTTTLSGEAPVVDEKSGIVKDDSDSEDNEPEFENSDNLEGGKRDPPRDVVPKSKPSRHERKARKLLFKLGLKPIPNVSRIIARGYQGLLFVTEKPEVYKVPHSDTYIIFGEMKFNNMPPPQVDAVERFEGDHTDTTPSTFGTTVPDVDEDEDEIDETGVDEKDIELVMNQSNASRAKAVKALKNNDNDIVNAIMELTMV